MMKRFNPFSIEETITKYNVSYEDAEEIVKKVKLKRSTNLEGFIFRYGEIEGTKKYNEYCEKSKHTKESFKQKYGDDWEFKWNNYLLSKNSRSLFKLIERYGYEEGNKRFLDISKKYKYSMSKQAYIDKYGEHLGNIYYTDLIKSMDSSTLEFFIKKYGDIDGKEIYVQSSLKKDSSSKEFFIKKYGMDKGMELYMNKCIKVSPIYNQLLKIYDKDEALIKYNQYLDTKIETYEIKKIKNEIYDKIKNEHKCKKSYSSQANNLFSILEEKLNYKLQYGSRKNELCLFDEKTFKPYYYDCYDKHTNTIIEFNGSIYHANPLLEKDLQQSWTTVFGKSYSDSLEYDTKKLNVALSKNYSIITVWDYEVKSKNNLYKKVNEIIGILQDESKKN